MNILQNSVCTYSSHGDSHSGKFGEVYKANMRSIIVAVKVTKRFSSEKAIRDFQNEMSILSEVVHPNIVRLYGIIREGERVYTVIAQEFNSK